MIPSFRRQSLQLELTDNFFELYRLVLLAVDKLDKAGIFAEQLDLSSFNSLVVVSDTPGNVQDEADVLASSLLIDVLQFDIDTGLCFHVRKSTRDGKPSLIMIKSLYSFSDDPKAGFNFVL